MKDFNFSRHEDIKKQSYVAIDNNDNKLELNKFYNSIPYRFCSYGYLDPGKEVFDFLKNSALCELIDETAFIALKSYHNHCFFFEKKPRLLKFRPPKIKDRIISESQIRALDAHYYDSKSVLRYRRGFQNTPIVKDKRLIKYDNGVFFTKDSSALFSLPDYKDFETSCNGWAREKILGKFSDIKDIKDVDTYYDFLSSKMMESCKDGNYDFMQSFLYFHIMTDNLHVTNTGGTIKHHERDVAPMFNIFLGSTPKYNLDEIRKIVIGMNNNQIFINFILLGTNFSKEFLEDLKTVSDNMPNVRLIIYSETFMLDNRRTFWNNPKMIDYLSGTPSFYTNKIE